MPAFVRQCADDFGELVRRQPEVGIFARIAATKTELNETFFGSDFSFEVSTDQPASLFLKDSAALLIVLDHLAFIIKGQLSKQMWPSPGMTLSGLDDQIGLRGRRDQFKFQLLGKLQNRMSREAQQLGEKGIPFFFGY